MPYKTRKGELITLVLIFNFCCSILTVKVIEEYSVSIIINFYKCDGQIKHSKVKLYCRGPIGNNTSNPCNAHVELYKFHTISNCIA